eukprot:5474619-Prymnesium_polylepis.1
MAAASPRAPWHERRPCAPPPLQSVPRRWHSISGGARLTQSTKGCKYKQTGVDVWSFAPRKHISCARVSSVR